MTIYEVIEKWHLSANPLNLSRYSRSQISLLCEDVEKCYANPLRPSAGRINQSLHTATSIVEAGVAVESLAIPLIFSKQIILPDPLYSLLSRKANSTWQRLPESGNQSFSDTPLIYSNWKTYWSTKIEDRISFLNERLPVLVDRLLKIRELVNTGFIVLHPWESAVDPEISNFKPAIQELKTHVGILKEITQKFRQDKYHLGARIGALGIVASSDNPQTGLKAGDPLWIGDKTEVLMMGLVHSILTKSFSSNFVESLPGDRVVFDYIRSGGVINPERKTIIPSVGIPDFSSALWSDIVAIRKDSELVSKLQDIILDIAYVNNEDHIAVLTEQMSEMEAKLKEDTSLKRFVKVPFAEMSVAAVVGSAANLVTGATLPASAAAAGMTAAAAFLFNFISENFSASTTEIRKRRDLIIRVNERLASK